MKRRISEDSTSYRKKRMAKFFRIYLILTPLFMYFSYILSGFFLIKDFWKKDLEECFVMIASHPREYYNDKSPLFLLCGITVWIFIGLYGFVKTNNNFMHGEEHGTAKWGDIAAFNHKYADFHNLQNNKILSQNVMFSYNESTLRNNNVFVCGGSGAGKTSFMLTPNLLNCHDCNVYTDPKGTLLEEFGNFLAAQPDTEVYSINMCEMEKSMKINPFLFLNKRMDVSKLIRAFIKNTENEQTQAAPTDPFWEKAETMFLKAIFLYVWDQCPRYDSRTGRTLEKNWRSVMLLMDEAQFEDDKNKSLLHMRMMELKSRDKYHPAVKAYERYANAAEDTVRSVLATAYSRMDPFDDEEVLNIFSGNDIPLNEIGIGRNGDRKTKINLFIVIPDDDDTFNFVPGIIYSLLIQQLYAQARLFQGKLPLNVGFWLDEFANIKMPNRFDRFLATCRSRGIYCALFLQSLSQMKTLFKEGAWEGLVSNCDTFLYLGGNEQSTYEYIEKLLGEWTIDKKTTGQSRGSNGSFSENADVLGKKLMSQYELRLLPNDECIIFVRGEEALRDLKWFPWEHKEYDKAKSYGRYDYKEGQKFLYNKEKVCSFLDANEAEYLLQKSKTDKNIKVLEIDPFQFMMMDLDSIGDQVADPEDIDLKKLKRIYEREQSKKEKELKESFLEQYPELSLADIFASPCIGEFRRNVIKDMLQHQVSEEAIKNIVNPEFNEEEVLAKKSFYYDMYSIQ